MKILVINPGSTTTKVALFDEQSCLCEQKIDHDSKLLSQFKKINDQLDMRTEAVRSFLDDCGVKAGELDVIVSRGGILPPVHHGAYIIDQLLVDTLLYSPVQEHASNMGAGIAFEISKDGGGVPAYIYDSISVDELLPEARLSGVKGHDRRSFTHVLNTRAVAQKIAEEEGFDLLEENVIIAHLGGGFSMNIQSGGELIDVVAADEGPFSAERAGALPIYNACEIARIEGADGLYSYEIGRGGLKSYLDTTDAREVEKRIAEGDKEAELVYRALAYQIAKYIGSLAPVVSGEVRAIILTGGLANSKYITDDVRKRVEYIAPVYIYPGELEKEALVESGRRLLRGEEEAYKFSLD
ncbi:MAG: butyrate kinase [Eubacteriales bacterium]|nr:butyrate kinase [Eubacteriales bacterium]MDD4541474.1 butyrate kinase [Eubacteriales bacterium]